MRQIIALINTTADGFMAGPEGDLQWHFPFWDDELCHRLCQQLHQADTLLLGRNTYQAMAGYWAGINGSLTAPRQDLVMAHLLNNTTKAVISGSMQRCHWQNTLFLHGALQLNIQQLKNQTGKNIVILGSHQLLMAMNRLDLIDGFEIWQHPVRIRRGLRLFESKTMIRRFKPQNIEPLASGVVQISYRRITV